MNKKEDCKIQEKNENTIFCDNCGIFNQHYWNCKNKHNICSNCALKYNNCVACNPTTKDILKENTNLFNSCNIF
jgi:hypothetical protein